MAFVLLSTLAACARVPDAKAIRSTIQAMAAAAEARRTGEVLDHVAADFTGNGGEFDRSALERLLRARVLAAQSLGVSIGDVEVELDGSRAIARFDVTLTDGSGRWLPDRRAVLRMTTGWRREGRGWLCYNANWAQR
ncbi:nuclear transport factor 2 family protein [Dokdonella sp.]|uniref:nuclear transport factor 2 family protein n=1 Tax=Dokdonella sp. TaxID=2291710 RepID=UPI001B19BF27|nr:nuclear transport factor 2 family protein [Dokdonella sp.]MBO9663133.1 nuclear transport factor 2 family protein [Dokdonella sp.]